MVFCQPKHSTAQNVSFLIGYTLVASSSLGGGGVLRFRARARVHGAGGMVCAPFEIVSWLLHQKPPRVAKTITFGDLRRELRGRQSAWVDLQKCHYLVHEFSFCVVLGVTVSRRAYCCRSPSLE